MQIEILKRFEGKKVRIILKNNFNYSNIVFEITEDNLIKFSDKYGEVLTVEPSYISAITEVGLEKKRINSNFQAWQQEQEKWKK